MNTVILEEPERTVIAQSPLRNVEIDSADRQAVTDSISRTVDVILTYTLEEFYYISPFQVGTELGEGPIYVIPNQTV